MMNIATLLLAAAVSVSAVPFTQEELQVMADAMRKAECTARENRHTFYEGACTGAVLTITDVHTELKDFLEPIGISWQDDFVNANPAGFQSETDRACIDDQVCIPKDAYPGEARAVGEDECSEAGGEVHEVTDEEAGTTLDAFYANIIGQEIEQGIAELNSPVFSEPSYLWPGDKVCVPKPKIDDAATGADPQDLTDEETRETEMGNRCAYGQLLSLPVDSCNNGLVRSVVAGSTLRDFANDNALSVSVLAAANAHIPNPDILCVGDQVCIPNDCPNTPRGVSDASACGSVATISTRGQTMDEFGQANNLNAETVASHSAQISGSSYLWPGDQVCVPQHCPPYGSYKVVGHATPAAGFDFGTGDAGADEDDSADVQETASDNGHKEANGHNAQDKTIGTGVYDEGVTGELRSSARSSTYSIMLGAFALLVWM